jgi:hypothetical protein
VISGNREGFNFREQRRTTRTIDDRVERPVWNHDELIHHNLLVLNRDAQVQGWFDVKDNRHWPGSGTNETGLVTVAKPGDIAADYTAKTGEGQPQGLTLANLRLRFEKNVYFAAPGQGWFVWGPGWARHKIYVDLHEFQTELSIDTESQVRDPGFADLLQLDLRIQANVMSLLKESYPKSPVPEVILGVSP